MTHDEKPSQARAKLGFTFIEEDIYGDSRLQSFFYFELQLLFQNAETFA